MSKVVDERVVVLNFDNKKFEKGTKQTMKSLKKLKKEMQFEEVSDSINEAYDNTDPSKVINGIEKVQKKFTAMEVATITAINRITNKALDSVERLTKSLSIDNWIAGWRAYEDEVKSVGTLLGQGYNESVVNEQLALLSKYSEATSYNYADMASNISKFTAAGVKLEDATQAIMGIANWAALSGQNAQKASIAMYQLAQAIGAGTVKLQDWKSIQNVSMDTQEFRQHVLDTAVAMGTLKKNADGTYKTLSGKAFNIKQFTTQLSEGWFTSDVLVATLQDYSGAIQDIFDLQDKLGGSTAKAVSAYQKQINNFKKGVDEFGNAVHKSEEEIAQMEFALKAFQSAQEARTFTDAINATKDAVTSGWRETFKAIFGEYNEAKTTWTQLADDLWNIFAVGGESRNKLLKAWGGKSLVANADAAKEELSDLANRLRLNGTAASKEDWQAFNTAVGGTEELKKAFIEAGKAAGTLYEDEEHVIHAVDGSVVSLKNFDESLESGWLNMTALDKATASLIDEKTGLFTNPLGGREDLFGVNYDENKEVIYETSGALVNLMKVLTALRTTVSKAWNDTFGITAEKLKSLTEGIKQFSRRLSSLVNKDGYFDRMYNIMRGIFSVGKVVVKIFHGLMIALKPITSLFTKGGNSAINIIEKLANKVTEFADTTDIFEKAGRKVAVFTQKVADVLVKVFKKVSEWVQAALPMIEKVIHILWSGIKAVFNVLGIIVQRVYEFIKSTVIAIKNSELFQKAIHKIADVIKKAYEKTKDIFAKFKNWVTTVNKTKFAETIKKMCKSIGDSITKMFHKIKGARTESEESDGTLSFLDKLKQKLQVLEPLMNGLKNLWTGIKNLFGPLIRLVGAALTALGDFLTSLGERIDGFVKGKNGLISFGELLRTLFKVGIATILTTWVTHIIKSITKLVDALSMFMTGMKGHSILERVALAIKQFAMAMLMFTAAIVILSKIDSSQVSRAMTSIATVLALYVGFLMSIKKLFANTERKTNGFSLFKKGKGLFSSNGGSSTGPAESITAIGTLLLSMSAGIFIISVATKKLADIKEDKMSQALTILVTIMGMLSVFLQQMKAFVKDKNMKVAMPGFMAFIGLSLLIKSLAKTMVQLSDLSGAQLIKGSVIVMTLCTGLAMVLKALAKVSGSISNSTSKTSMGGITKKKSGSLTMLIGVLLSLTTLFKRLGNIMKEMSSISTGSFIKGAAALGTMALALVLVLHSITKLDKQEAKNAKKVIGVLMSMTLIFTVMSWLLKDLANMEPQQFKQSMIALSVMMGFVLAIIATMKVIDLFNKSKVVDENVNVKKKTVTKFKGIFGALLGLAAVVLATTLLISKLTEKIQNGKQLAGAIAVLVSIVSIIGILIAGAVLITKQDNDAHIGADRFKKLNKIINSITILLLAVALCIKVLNGAMNEPGNTGKVLASVLLVLSTLGLLFVSIRLLINKTKTMSEEKITRMERLMDSIRNLMLSMAVVIAAITLATYGKSVLASFGVLALGMVTVIAAIWAVNKLSKGLDTTKINAISLLLLAIAGAVRIMALMTKQLNKINSKGIKNLIIISAVLAAFVGIAAALSATGLGTGILAVSAAILVFAAAVWLVVDALEKLVNVAYRLMNTEFDSETIANKLMAIAQGVMKAGKAIGLAISGILVGILEGLWLNITGFVDKVMTYLSGLTAKLGKIFAELIGGIFQGLAETDAMGSLVDMLLDMVDVLLERLPEVTDKLITTGLELIDILIKRVPEIAAKLSMLAFEIVINFLDSLAKQLQENKTRLVDAIHNLFTAVKDFFLELFGIKKSGEGDSAEFSKWGGGVVSGFLSGIKEFPSKVGKFFENMWNGISTWWDTNVVQPFLNFGRNIIDGLWKGLQEGWNKITGFFNDLGNNIKTGWENFWGIHSPSRVFKKFGNYMTEGLAIGLEDDTHVIQAVKDLGDNITDEFNGSDINALMAAQLENLDLDDDTLVIRPVMDLSNIQNGASEIDDIMRSFNGYSINGMGNFASGVASSMSKGNDNVNKPAGTVNNTTNNDSQYITINVNGTNAQEIADEVSKELQKRVNRRDKRWR